MPNSRVEGEIFLLSGSQVAYYQAASKTVSVVTYVERKWNKVQKYTNPSCYVGKCEIISLSV